MPLLLSECERSEREWDDSIRLGQLLIRLALLWQFICIGFSQRRDIGNGIHKYAFRPNHSSPIADRAEQSSECAFNRMCSGMPWWHPGQAVRRGDHVSSPERIAGCLDDEAPARANLDHCLRPVRHGATPWEVAENAPSPQHPQLPGFSES